MHPWLTAPQQPPTPMELDALFSVDCSQTSNMSDTSEASDDKDKTGDICRDYLRNVCKRGKRCRYRHPHPSEAQKLGRRQEYTFCHDFQNAGCHRANCKFIHCTREEEEYYKQTGQLAVRLQQAAALCVGPVPSELPLLRGEVPICKDFLKGDCKRAAKCKYRHLNSTEYQYELRRPTDGHMDAVVAVAELDKREYEAMPTAAAVAPMTPFKRRRLESDDLENGYCLANHTSCAQIHNHLQNPTHPQPAHAMSAATVNHLSAPPHNPPPQPTTLHPTIPPPPHLGFRGLPAGAANYHLLEEENNLLRRKIEELKKQVSDLAATNEVLLEQNARFRSSKNQSVSVAPPVVTVSQVVTPTISPAAAVARPGMPTSLNVLNVTLSQLTMTANSELVMSRMGQPIVPQELTAQTLGAAINPPVTITTQTIVPMSLSMESIAAVGAAAMPPVAVSMAPVAASMGQALGIVSQPQTAMTSMTPSLLSGASTAMISYPIMSHTQLPTNSLR